MSTGTSKASGTNAASASAIEVPRGLKGVVVTETGIGDVRGGEGFYHYRQYSAVDLAKSRPVEDVWRLLIDGELPVSAADRESFCAEIRPLWVIPKATADALPAIARTTGHPLNGLRTALSMAAEERGCRPVYDLKPHERRADALFVAAVTPTILTALHRLRSGHEPVSPRDDLDYAANYLWMLTGREPSAAHAAAIRRYLISTIDHGFNASTFTARVIASTGADMGACIAGAIGALSGPLHGGAPSRALDLLNEIGEADRARAVVAGKVTRGERIMGFGHAVYTTTHTTGVAATIRRMISTFEGEERAERAYALMETLRMVVTQALVPKVGGGRVGVREWMVFNDIVREKLLDMDYNQWTAEIQRMIPSYGQTLKASASKLFEAGIIERRWYLTLTQAAGAS